jgi:polyhydroxyalkanoate synthesis regulator protein
VDRRTDANITRSVLLQVIADQEQREPALLSEEFLAQLIRASNSSMALSVKEFLDRNMTQYLGSRAGDGGAQTERPAGV